MDPQIQSGVIAFRRGREGAIEVLLVKKPRSRNWGIPKGKLEPGLSPAENAAKEAFEEAGVRGTVGTEPLGKYRALKRVGDRQRLLEISAFLLEVRSCAKTWPEKATRLVRWCSIPEAIRLLREPLLVELCRSLGTESVPGSRDRSAD